MSGSTFDNDQEDSKQNFYNDDSDDDIVSPSLNVEEYDVDSFKYKVYEALESICNFDCDEFILCGQLEHAPLVFIAMKDGKTIKFPFHENEVGNVIESFEQSPYGKGTETIVDTSFRNSWQLNPEEFQIMNPEWDTFINEVMLARIKDEMAIETPFVANLYKLLLYKSGSFFKPHRDSEKESGMFATLVIQLPSKYSGGQLVVKHDGKSKSIDFDSTSEPNNEFSTFFSVFYCDCEHELLPVTDGVRICLVYNLVITNEIQYTIPLAPFTDANERNLASILLSWKEFKNSPMQLVYVLSHKYTDKNLSFANLKSTDKGVATLLKRMSTECSLTIYLGFLEKTSKGFGNEDRFTSEMCDIEHLYHMTKLRPIENNAQFNVRGTLYVDFEEEVIPVDCFDDEPVYDEERVETGNEGCEVTLLYQSVVLIIWQNDSILQVMIEAGMGSVAVENAFLKEYKKDGNNAKLLKLAKYVAEMNPDLPNDFSKLDSSVALLTAMISFNDLKLLQTYLYHHTTINREIILLLKSQCDKYGCNSLLTQLKRMFKLEKNSDIAAEYLELLGEDIVQQSLATEL